MTAPLAPLWAKLNLRAQSPVLVLGAPAEFEPALRALGDRQLQRRLGPVARVEFGLAFVHKKVDLDRIAKAMVARAPDDPILWFAYPKATSPRYACDFNRDRGWEVLTAAAFRPVRQVAIDANWTALRFRRAANTSASSRRDRLPR